MGYFTMFSNNLSKPCLFLKSAFLYLISTKHNLKSSPSSSNSWPPFSFGYGCISYFNEHMMIKISIISSLSLKWQETYLCWFSFLLSNINPSTHFPGNTYCGIILLLIPLHPSVNRTVFLIIKLKQLNERK